MNDRAVRRWPRRTLAGAVVSLVAGWAGGNCCAAIKIARGGVAPLEDRDPGSLGLAFENVTYGKGLPAWYVPGAPDEPVIVVVHGYGNNRTATLNLGPPLHELGYGLLFVNLGYVAGARRYGGGQAEARDVAEAVAWVERNIGVPVVVLAFSAGALAALSAVATGTRVAALVADSGFVGYREVVTFRAYVGRWFTSLLPLVYPLISGGGHVVDIARQVRHRPFAAPTLIIQGTADGTVPPAGGPRLARLTGGQLWLVPGVGHAGAFDHDRTAYIARVDKFIRATKP